MLSWGGSYTSLHSCSFRGEWHDPLALHDTAQVPTKFSKEIYYLWGGGGGGEGYVARVCGFGC